MKNRKLFAIITLVAFMLTMMPMMAFAASGTYSTLEMEDASAKVFVSGAKADALEINVDLDGDLTANQILVIFAERNGNLSDVDYFGFSADFACQRVSAKGNYVGYIAFDKTAFESFKTNYGTKLYVASEATGTVTFKAYIYSFDSTIGNGYEFQPAQNTVNNVAAYYKGSVDGAIQYGFSGNGCTGKFTTTQNEISVNATIEGVVDKNATGKIGTANKVNGDKVVVVNEKDKDDTDVVELTPALDKLKANNGVNYYDFSLQFLKGTSKLAGEDVDIYVNKIGATANKETVTTSINGKVDFKVSATKPGTYIVTVECGNFSQDFKVKFEGTAAATPEVTFITNNTIAVDEETSRVAEIALYDGLGNEVDWADNNGIIVEIVEAPEDSALEDTVIEFDAATEQPANTINADGEIKFQPDAVGTYKIKAYNDDTGVAAYATIKADEFGVVDHATISYPYASYAPGATTPAPTVRLVDKAGVVKDANKGACKYSYAGVGVDKFYTANTAVGNVDFKAGQITLSDDKDYAGKEVTVSVVVNGKYAASTTLTIGVKAAAINFTEANGQAAKDIAVTGQLVDLNGNKVALSATDKIEVQSAVVISRPEGAIVSVDTDDFDYKNEFRNKGIANIVVTSNMEGTVQANLVVKITTKVEKYNDNQIELVDDVYYVAGVATVNVGETTADVEEANDIVTFVIGTNTFIANNKATTSDVAPYIVDGRTFIPVRAFVEATGAAVEYDAATQVVTITGDGIDAQMTIGSNILTVNGETVVMDTAAAIKDGRTVLPVRYAGQAIGYNFECAYGANGAVTAVTMFK